MKKNNYRNSHIITIIVTLGVMLAYFACDFFPNKKWVTIVIALADITLVGKFGGPYEKKDELTRLNLGRANGITLIAVIAALFVLSIVGQNSANKALFAGDVYVFAALSAILLRSILFLFFDRTPKAEEE
ncbi:hypothetical protein [Ruminococcus sp.]|jgi:hypothetical protein|uniref:hypothetical protein n=1 Tax=Ruminococcus sp. TaxID=41978 RepID=UPI0025EA571D|nr:hypothetical protein [Ruminococcus sp.]